MFPSNYSPVKKFVARISLRGRGEGEPMNVGEDAGWSGLDEHSVRLELQKGTVLYPEECGFGLPDGRYVRIYPDGVRIEQPDGTAANGEDHVLRPQLFAHRCRVGGNPHAFHSHRAASYAIAIDVEVVMPDALATMHDDGLIELAHLIMRRIIEMELVIDLDDGDLVAEFAEGHPYSHLLDLSAAGPF